MTDALTALNAHLGALLLVLNFAVLLFGAVLIHHTSSLRRERRAQAGHLAEQLGRAHIGLQKINSSVIAQTNELKGRLGELKPALEHAEQLLREGASFTPEFKAVRGELRQLDERVETLNRTAGEVAVAQATASNALVQLDERIETLNRTAGEFAAGQATTSGALGELNRQVGVLRQEVATIPKVQPTPAPAPVAELRQIQEQVGALRQAVTASAQAHAVSSTELRSGLSALAAEQSRAAQVARESLAAELRQQEARFRQLSEKFLAESAQLRTRIESESRALPTPPPRQVTPDNGHSGKAELDAETRKEFRKIADRLDGLQRRMEEIIKL